MTYNLSEKNKQFIKKIAQPEPLVANDIDTIINREKWLQHSEFIENANEMQIEPDKLFSIINGEDGFGVAQNKLFNIVFDMPLYPNFVRSTSCEPIEFLFIN